MSHTEHHYQDVKKTVTSKPSPTFKVTIREGRKKSGISVMIAVSLMSLSPPALQWVNAKLANNHIECKSYTVLEKDIHTGRRSYYKFVVTIDGKKRTIDTDKDLLDRMIVGQAVEICIGRGGLGFDFIKEIRP